MPVSLTATSSSKPSVERPPMDTSTNTSPVSVNLIAFPTRLVTICLRRIASPRIQGGTSGRMRRLSSSPFSTALACSSSTTDSMAEATSKSTSSSSNFPASTLERSRMSFRSPSNVSPDW